MGHKSIILVEFAILLVGMILNYRRRHKWVTMFYGTAAVFALAYYAAQSLPNIDRNVGILLIIFLPFISYFLYQASKARQFSGKPVYYLIGGIIGCFVSIAFVLH